MTPENLTTFTGLPPGSRDRALVVYQDQSDGPVLVGGAASLDEAVALIAALDYPPATDAAYRDEPPNVQAMTAALGRDQMARLDDPEQLLFLVSVLDDEMLSLVVAWEPHTAEDGSIGIFERARVS